MGHHHSHREHHHDHHHVHSHNHSSVSNLKVALFLNLGFAIVEIIGGVWTGSVAILSDAVHDLGDSLSLGIATFLQVLSRKESNHRFTFGYRRMSLLSALITCTFLIAGSIAVLVQAIPRLFSPVMPKLPEMLGLAVFGVMVNGYAAWRLRRGKTLIHCLPVLIKNGFERILVGGKLAHHYPKKILARSYSSRPTNLSSLTASEIGTSTIFRPWRLTI